MDLTSFVRPELLVVFVMVALRTSAAVTVGPLASWPGVPPSIRVILGIGIALAITPIVPTAVPPAQLHPGFVDLVMELGLGLLLGVASSLVVSALQLAAGLVDFQAGFTFGASLDPMSGAQSGPLEHFLSAFAAVLFLDLNGHQLFLEALSGFFQLVPIGAAPHLAGPAGVAGFFTTIFVAALVMALPVVTMLLLVDVGLALLGRTAPQFNLFAVGLPARVAVTLVALATLLPVIATQLGQVFAQLPRLMPALASA